MTRQILVSRRNKKEIFQNVVCYEILSSMQNVKGRVDLVMLFAYNVHIMATTGPSTLVIRIVARVSSIHFILIKALRFMYDCVIP